MAQQIEQGDYIFFQDTTIGGPPVLWDWYFPGGSPTGSAFQNPIIRYLSPNSLGYNANLYVEDVFSISSTKSDNNAIFVTPENLSAISLSQTPGTLTLSQDVTYTVFGPTGKLSYYEWNLPGTGGFTGPTSQTQNLAVNSWLSITGSEFGSLSSSYTATASVIFFSVTGNTVSTTNSVTFIKCGSYEAFNLAGANGNFPSPTTQYVQVTNTTSTTDDFGLPGSGIVFSVSQPLYPNAIETLSSHVQGERVEFWSCSKDFVFGGILGLGVLGSLQVVSSKQAFDILGVSYTGWETLTRYTQGNYMFPYDLSTYFNSTFYVGDVSNSTSSSYIINDVGISNFNSLFFDDAFYASQSSVSISGPWVDGTVIYPAALLTFQDGAGGASGGFGLQCLPSYQLVGSDVTLTLTVENSSNGTIAGYSPGQDNVISVPISSFGINPNGNSPDFTLFFAQDTGTPGYVSIINSAIALAGFSSNIEAFASPDFCYQPLIYSANVGSYFQGMKIAIKDNLNPLNPLLTIIRVKIECDTSMWFPPFNVYPVAGRPTGGINGNWLGFASEYISNPYMENNVNDPAFRGFIFKGNT
jgi:hypothetical protein